MAAAVVAAVIDQPPGPRAGSPRLRPLPSSGCEADSAALALACSALACRRQPKVGRPAPPDRSGSGGSVAGAGCCAARAAVLGFASVGSGLADGRGGGGEWDAGSVLLSRWRPDPAVAELTAAFASGRPLCTGLLRPPDSAGSGLPRGQGLRDREPLLCARGLDERSADVETGTLSMSQRGCDLQPRRVQGRWSAGL